MVQFCITSFSCISGKLRSPAGEVDGDRWTLVLWYVQEQGINRIGTVSDGGRAIQQALSQVEGEAHGMRNEVVEEVIVALVSESHTRQAT
jgi:hypothetical protein